MAIEFVESNDTVEIFKDKVNNLATGIGDLADSDFPDSDMVSAVIRISNDNSVTDIAADVDSNQLDFTNFVAAHDSDYSADQSDIQLQFETVGLVASANADALAFRDDNIYVESLGVRHDSLSEIDSNQHIDWSVAQPSGVNIDASNTPQDPYVITSSSTDTRPARHPTGGVGQATLSGNNVISSITVNALGHTTGVNTRQITASQVSALPADGKADNSAKADRVKDEDGQYRYGSYDNNASQMVRRNSAGEIIVNDIKMARNNNVTAVSDISHIMIIEADSNSSNGNAGGTRQVQSVTVSTLRTKLFESQIQSPEGVRVGAGDGFLTTLGGDQKIFSNTNTDSWIRISGAGLYVGDTVNGIATTGDVVASFSDMRLKNKVSDIDNALDKVGQLSGFIYEGNDEAIKLGAIEAGVYKVGLSAQEVKAVLPEAIESAPINEEHGTDYMTVDYSRVVPLLIEAIKELKSELDQLKETW